MRERRRREKDRRRGVKWRRREAVKEMEAEKRRQRRGVDEEKEEKNACRNLVGKPEGNRALGRPRLG
jgi:hypothetical protein